MKRQQDANDLYSFWRNVEIPSNLTEEYSECEKAFSQIMEYGEINYFHFF
jgi:hypothetical protein